MSRICAICGKKPMRGATVSHAHNVVKRWFMPNIQKVRAIIDGRVARINVCTSCIRANKVTKPDFIYTEINNPFYRGFSFLIF
jgi:large subunit ribosomal protein L28